ncbi:MAG TPA: alpha/beta hydrolase [Burkholderiaceae bacterium]|jgi:pimeloyl-ACP methyl ester carboxylesterase
MNNAARIPDHSVQGHGDTTVFLLHGAYGAKEYWWYVIQALVARGLRVVAWDAPGYGVSEVAPHPDMAYFARAFASLFERHRTARNVLLGHSMGGVAVQKFCQLCPGGVDAIVLSATMHTFNHSGPEWQERFLRERVAPLTAGKSIAEYAPALLRSMMGPGAAGPGIELVIENIKRMNPLAFQAAIGALSRYDEPANLDAITAPTLCIAGSLDETCPARVMKIMADRLGERGEFIAMDGVGHFGWAERPQEYNRHVFEFLDRRLAEGRRPS